LTVLHYRISPLHHTICIISWASAHKCVYNLEQECRYPYNIECILYNLVVIDRFRCPLLDCYLLEAYLALPSFDSPRTSLMPH
jgi:hypothetical protein